MRFLLIPFSIIYWITMSLRNFLWDKRVLKAYALDARVISVGNITWGGTGKTPAVIAIARELLKNGRRPAILIRGYGDDEKDLFPRLIPEVSVVVGKDRIKTGKEAINRQDSDTLLLDDGFQHRRLKRDIDIVCIDATNPFGNRRMIPAGSMREGISGLKRANIFLITKVDLVEDEKALRDLEKMLKELNPDAIIAKSIHKPEYFYKISNEQLVDIETLKNKNIALVSAIGDPDSFEKTVSRLEIDFKKHFIFRDHHLYGEKDLRAIKDYCAKNNIETIVTTEKDAVKLKAISSQLLAPHPCGTGSAISFLVLHIELRIIENEQKFYDRLNRSYNN